MKVQLALIALVAALIGGCEKAAPTKTDTHTPEEALARLDGRTDTKPYATQLNKLGKRCTENRNDIASIVRDVAKRHQAAGYGFMTNLETGNFFVEFANDHESKRFSCMELRQFFLDELEDRKNDSTTRAF